MFLIQREKIEEHCGKDDEEFVEKVIEEDCEINFEVVSLIIDINQVIESINSNEQNMKSVPKTAPSDTEMQNYKVKCNMR